MARPLRFVPANALVEVTTRTIQRGGCQSFHERGWSVPYDESQVPGVHGVPPRKTSKKTQAPHHSLSPSPAIQCPGLTRIGHHRADKATAQRPRESHAGVCPRRKIADFLGPDHHPARPNNDVFRSASPSWLSSTPATTPFNGDRGARPPTFNGDSRKTSKKTQAPHHTPPSVCFRIHLDLSNGICLC
jgi:hypothetical protein